MIGLSLSGGGVKGSYEIGAYLALKKCHIKIDGFVGTSIGAFNAAMLAAGKEKELLYFWQEVDVGSIMNFKPELVKALKEKKSLKSIKTIIVNFKDIVFNKGVNTDGLKQILQKYNLEKYIRKSKKDFGLVTVRFNDLKPLCLFKEDIAIGELNDYILGSCYFPIFKQEKMLDDSYYLDGGFYDNSPTNMLIEKNYKKIYVVDMGAIGRKRKIKDKSKVVIIKPSRSLGGIFNVNDQQIKENIKIGYFDTLKIIKHLDGEKFIFTIKRKWRYEYALSNVKSKTLKEISKFFKETDPKKLIIKALEYVMKLEKYEYAKIYNPFKLIKQMKKNIKNDKGIYSFLKQLK